MNTVGDDRFRFDLLRGFNAAADLERAVELLGRCGEIGQQGVEGHFADVDLGQTQGQPAVVEHLSDDAAHLLFHQSLRQR